MRVTFFVQSYNTERLVGECLESVLAQRGAWDVEVLVIDDASTDGTVREIERFGASRLRLVRHATNRGAIATANEGYAAAAGDFVIRIDSDDRLRPEFLQLTVPALAAAPGVGLAYGDIATIDDRGAVTAQGGMVRRDGRGAQGDEFFPLLLENFIPAPSTLVRRAALEPLLPIPSHFRFLDWYLTTGIAETWETLYVDRVLADYRVHPGNMHLAMVRDRTGERTSREIIDRLLTNGRRAAEKAAQRRRVLAGHYLTYADKYFGCEMDADARRCYWRAIGQAPSLAVDGGVARRLAATLVGRRVYESVKGRVATAS
jgi:glycosyltransferase involved in cell wall biosynthesis